MAIAQQETVTLPDDPRLRQYLEAIDAIRADARGLADGLTREQFNWRPDGRRWSVGQCLQHIVLTARLYPRKIEKMLAESRARQQRERAYREGVFSRWFVRSMEPPPSIRVRTMSKVEPSADLDPATVLAEFDAIHLELARLTRAADGLSLVHGRTRSPFLPVLQFTLGQTIAMNLAHARRHLWQARQVRGAAGFPV
jgi:hypothetical protein